MSTASNIEWTDATWNPVVGCTRVSAGCDNCYAVTMSHRLEAMGQSKYAGLTVLNQRGDRHFSGVVRCDGSALTIPLRWRKPRRVFVNSMSDLFHRDVRFDFIAAVYAIAAACPQHTFQVLTKRPELAEEFYRWMENARAGGAITPQRKMVLAIHSLLGGRSPGGAKIDGATWPLPNVWLGTSCEDQAAADKRIPHLLRCPAALRFLSCEPLLGPIALPLFTDGGEDLDENQRRDCGLPTTVIQSFGAPPGSKIDWVIVGGESGAGARLCDLEWIRWIVLHCQVTSTPCFVKQLGAVARVPIDCMPDGDWKGQGWPVTSQFEAERGFSGTCRLITKDRKGGDLSEWPEQLRVREMPRERGAA